MFYSAPDHQEKMAKAIKQLPKIISELKEAVTAWEAKESTTFCVPGDAGVGVSCLEFIEQTEDQWGRRKEMEAAEKKAAKSKDLPAPLHPTGGAGPRASIISKSSKRASDVTLNPLGEITASHRNSGEN